MQRSTRARLRHLAAALVTISALAGGTLAGAAQAADLIVLGPDSATIGATLAYDHVYIGDGATLRFAGDTALSANDVYIAGGATLRTCFVPGVGDNACTAGRNLLIQSTGQVNIGSGINLTAGAGTPRPGGSLVISGSSVSVSGGIDTSGSMGGGSGAVAISSGGAISLSSAYYQASVNAPGAAVSLHGGSIGLTGDIDTGGSDSAIVSAGEVDVSAANGPVTIRGDVNASGRDGTGGSGNNVSLHGTEVRVGRVDTSAATGSPGAVGIAGSVGIGGTASVSVSDVIDARGASGVAGVPSSAAGNVSLASSGPVLASTIYASGSDGNGAPPGGAGGIVIAGSAIAVGQLFVNGGTRAGAGDGYGGPGGGVSVTSGGPLSVDEVEAFGGNSVGAPGGHGGQIVLTGDGIFTSELRTTPGSSSGNAAGGSAGPIIVNGRSTVNVLGGVFANGASASGGAMSPAGAGGSGGAVVLHAASGSLSLAAPIRTNGGNGGNAPAGQKAGSGGDGGGLDLVGTPIDPIAGITTEGGDGGYSNDTDHRGRGGNGGALHAWSETDIFGTLRAISTAGGGGVPPGIDGPQLRDSGPTGLSVDANGVLSFTSQSSSAEGYRVFRTLGDETAALLTTGATRVTLPALAVCTPVTYQVQAFQSAVGWASPATPAVPWVEQPSATQRCTDAPTLTHAKTVIVKRKALSKAKGGFTFVATTNGLGTVSATATTKGVKAPLAVTTVPLTKVGTFLVTLKLDQKVKLKYVQPKKKKGKKKRPPAVAKVTVRLVATAPTGKATSSITVPVEVRT